MDVPGEEELPGFVEIDVDEMSETPHNLISLLLPNKTIWGGAKRRNAVALSGKRSLKINSR